MAQLSQDRLVRKEVALGTIREIGPPKTHIGLSTAPFRPVQSDDVIFQYAIPEVDGLAPARAEDAESELAQKDDSVGTGRASLLDWALKDHYDASDVSRYREFLRLAELSGGESFPLTTGSMTEDFASKLARDLRLRRRKLDNRIEWLIMEMWFKGAITYNDGNVQFSVNYGRPAGQQDQDVAGDKWDLTTADPIDDLLTIQETMYDTYGVTITQGITSRKVARNILNSSKFASRTGFSGADPAYAIDGWGWEAAQAVVERATGITLTTYDAVYRTRALGSTTTTNNRFTPEHQLLLLPSQEDIAEVAAETEVGFAATLTSPHPEGNWSPGFYEWERSTVDPWGQDIGSGVKAFPVAPHLEYTYVAEPLTA